MVGGWVGGRYVMIAEVIEELLSTKSFSRLFSQPSHNPLTTLPQPFNNPPTTLQQPSHKVKKRERLTALTYQQPTEEKRSVPKEEKLPLPEHTFQ